MSAAMITALALVALVLTAIILVRRNARRDPDSDRVVVERLKDVEAWNVVFGSGTDPEKYREDDYSNETLMRANREERRRRLGER